MKNKPSYEELEQKVLEFEELEAKRKQIILKLREKAESRLTSEQIKNRPPSREQHVLFDELQVYQVELEMQNDELRSTQIKLERSRDHFFMLFHKAPVGYFLLDMNGMVSDANQTICSLMGRPRDMFINKPIADFIQPPDRGLFYSKYKAFYKHPEDKYIEIQLIKQDGMLFHAGIEGRLMETVAGATSTQLLLMSVTNITRQKTAEKRAEHIQQILRAIRNIDKLITTETDEESLIEGACDNLIQSMGYYNAWIALTNEAGDTVLKTASSGFNGGFKKLESQFKHGQLPANTRKALELDDILVIQNPVSECTDCPLSTQYPGRAGMAHRLEFKGKLYGVISVSVPATFAEDEEARNLFKEISRDLAFGLNKIHSETQLHRFNHIITTIPNPMAFLSNDYCYLAVNNAYTTFYNIDRDQIIGKTPADFFGRSIFESKIKPHMDQCLKGESLRYEVEVDFPGNGRRWMEMAYFPYRNENGEIKGIVSHGLDITDVKRSEKKLATIINNTPVGICITDQNGYFENVNSAYCKLYKYEAAELIGKHFSMVVPDEQKEYLRQLHDSFIQGEIELRGEWSVIDKHGKIISILADAAKIKGSDGRPLKVTFVMDITAKKELEHLKEDVERIMRHDLRSPLNGIIGFSQLMLETFELTERQKKYLNNIVESGIKMLDMINMSLDLFKIESGRYDFTPVTVDMLSIIRRIFSDVESFAISKQVTLDMTFDLLPLKADRQVLIKAEELLTYSIFSNLIKNAVEASPNNGKISVDIINDDEWVAVRISNSGAVPAEIRKSFFDKYSTCGKQHGTGLGTYIAKLMTEVQSGTIAMETNEKSGTTITIRLPALNNMDQ